MRFVRYEEKEKNSTETLGVEIDNNIYNTVELANHLNLHSPQTMSELLKNSKKGHAQLNLVFAKARELNIDFKDYIVPREHVHFLPLVECPEKILCVGMNYVDHIKATDGDVPTTPVFFSKFSNALAAHNQSIPLPNVAQKVDYEAELVIVIGQEVNGVCQRDAAEAIFGYSIGNDLSERGLQMQSSQWLIGKSLDYFAPIGPALVTKDEIDDVQNLKIRTERNGTVVQNASTKDMLFTVSKIVSEASRYMTLKPGDVIFTGTPRGVILEQKQHESEWLQSKDRIDITIESIGTLSNTLV